ncbi:MAG: hypothetical protein V4501_03005 [Pseudomonadota bacterium]
MKLSELKSRIIYYDENKGIFRKIFGDSTFIYLLKQYIHHLGQLTTPDTADIRFSSFTRYLEERSIAFHYLDLLGSETLSGKFFKVWFNETPPLMTIPPLFEKFEFKAITAASLEIYRTELPPVTFDANRMFFYNILATIEHTVDVNADLIAHMPHMGNPARQAGFEMKADAEDRVVIFGENREGLGEIFKEKTNSNNFSHWNSSHADINVSDEIFDSTIHSIHIEPQSKDTNPIGTLISLKNDPLNNDMWVLILTFLKVKMLLRVRATSHLFHNLPLLPKDEKYYFFKSADYHYQNFLKTLPAPKVITHQQENFIDAYDDYNVEPDGTGFVMRL